MMKFFIYIMFLTFCSSSWAENIESVLERSAEFRFSKIIRIEPSDQDSITLNLTFDKLIAMAQITPESVKLHVVGGPLNAEAFMGKHVVTSRELAKASSDEQLFILAHELGHIVLGHWAKLISVYKKHVPGEVTKEVTDAVAGPMAFEVGSVLQSQEYEADAFALQLLRKFNGKIESAISAIRLNPFLQGDAAHPSAKNRIMHLRSIEIKEEK